MRSKAAEVILRRCMKALILCIIHIHSCPSILPSSHAAKWSSIFVRIRWPQYSTEGSKSHKNTISEKTLGNGVNETKYGTHCCNWATISLYNWKTMVPFQITVSLLLHLNQKDKKSFNNCLDCNLNFQLLLYRISFNDYPRFSLSICIFS